MGNYALTLVESLSTLAVMGEAAKFQQAVDWLSANLEWRSVEVSVFEANIRVLGGPRKLLLLLAVCALC
jgi:mannosidase alpha-like ER degradation enhancer 1